MASTSVGVRRSPKTIDCRLDVAVERFYPCFPKCGGDRPGNDRDFFGKSDCLNDDLR